MDSKTLLNGMTIKEAIHKSSKSIQNDTSIKKYYPKNDDGYVTCSVFPTILERKVMKTVYNIIKELQNISSTNDKISLLKSHKDNNELRDYLNYVYNPKYNYYITKITHNMEYGIDITIEQIENIVDRLSNRIVTGHAARDEFISLYESVSLESQELLYYLLIRDCRAKINISTINKVWDGLIPVTPYMRCSLPKKVKLETWPWDKGVYAQLKSDGQFCNFNIYENDFSVTSRNGNIYPKEYFTHIYDELKIQEGFQFHGELVVYKNGVLLNRKTGNGILTSLMKDGELPENHVIKFDIWDIIPIKEAVHKGKYNNSYYERVTFLESFLKDNKYATLIETDIVYSYEEALENYRNKILSGFEGSVIKHPDGIWEDTDSGSKYVVKLKADFECELKIIGFVDGNGKNKDTFGSIQCVSSDNLLKVNVSGFSDKKRKEISDNRNYYLDKIITVRSNAIIDKVKSDVVSLFLPRFVEERFDKNEADSLEQVYEAYDNAIRGIK